MGRKKNSFGIRPPRLDATQQAKLAGAIAAHQRGDVAVAAQAYREILAVVPRSFDALNLLGAAAIQTGSVAEGAALIRRAIAIDPGQSHAHSNLSRALLELGDAQGAVDACDRALRLDPGAVDPWYNRGNALLALRRYTDAAQSYQRALQLRPQHADALNNLGNTLRLMRQPGPALETLDACLALAPSFVNAINNRGLVFLDLGRTAEALAEFDRALALAPTMRETLNNRGNALMQMRRYDEAGDTFTRLTEVAPDYMYAFGNLLHARIQCCDWRDHAELHAQVVQRVDASAQGDFPFSYLCVSGSAESQLRCARAYTQDQYPAPPTIAPPLAFRHDRIRVAYLSGDFGEHPVSYLLTGVFERHDRTAFETIALAWGTHDDGAVRRRIQGAFARFIDVSALTDADVVRLMRELEIDVAIDLTGHTRGSRTGIFALRGAPVQVNYLGLPATMGAGYIDYLIADRMLVPAQQRTHYAEQIVWMPDTYQPNDTAHQATPPPSRTELGLPADGLVLCSFNSPAKINPSIFDVWMRILAAVPHSVLWLVAPHPAVVTNLRREATTRGVDPARLVFAPRCGYAQYLGRYAHADLFLDTLPFNAGATASDALSRGIPVLTCAGECFASRMAASLLTSLGLDELIAVSLEDYETRAVALARDPARLASLRATLADRRTTHAFFDTDRYCRHLESALRTMVRRHEDGLPAQAFAVEALAAPGANAPRY